MADQPLLSFIVVLYNMRREAPRTLFSLTQKYQQFAGDVDYEVIVVDNGSSEPVDAEMVTDMGKQFRYYYLETDSVSPSGAINFGADKSTGRYIAVCVDGARIMSPGVLHLMRLAVRLHGSPIVATLAWHLGSKPQGRAIADGYNQQVEDALLETVDWRNDGYKLFDIAVLAPSSKDGWFLPFAESNCLAVTREMFDKLGGFDEKFTSKGGGLVNLDYLKRSIELPDSKLVVLLGEGTFHQFHGGVATNAPPDRHPAQDFLKEYEQLRGHKYKKPKTIPLFLGKLPAPARRFLSQSIETQR